jgi:hypothetical protein
MASQPAVLQQCFQEASTASRRALEYCLEQAINILQQAEARSFKVAERNELAQAWRELQQHKPAWCERYPRDLLVAFNAAAQAPAKAAADAPAPAQSFVTSGHAHSGHGGLFALVEDAHVAQAIESSRLLQQVLPVVDQVLSELNTLMSTAQGLPNVRPELNPVRPEIFTQTLRALITSASIDTATSSLWVRHIADPLGRELKAIYERLVKILARANVQAAGYRVLQAPAHPAAGRRRGGAAAANTGAAALDGAAATTETADKPPSQYADLSGYEINDALFQDFLFHGGSHAQQRLAPSYYASVEQEMAALRAAPDEPWHEELAPPQPDYQALPAVDRPTRLVDVLSQLSSQVWGVYARSRERSMVRTQLKKDATRVGQVLGLEVVRKLVNQVAQDPRLLVPVREAIVALEPSLLRLAMVDPRFFSDESHPGRRLMERVAQRSFKYNDEYSSQFDAFFKPVAAAFNELNQSDIDSAQPFGAVLTRLEDAWDAQDEQEQQQRGDVLQAMRFAEERQAQADQIAWDLSKRPDLDNVPGVVLDFLFGPWALVMAHARLTDENNQIDPQGFGSTVPDLLWSVKKEVTLKRPAKLIEMIPGLLGKLHEGLDLLGQDPKESEAFFEAMMKLHRPVLKLRRAKSRRDAKEPAAIVLESEEVLAPATEDQRKPRVPGQPWLGKEELDAAGFEDTLPSDHAELMAELPLPAAPAPEAADPAPAAGAPAAGQDGMQAEQVLLGLREGHWVDLYSRRRWLRAQLVWASARGTLFMFVSHGGQPHSMTKRSCERLIRERLLRPVDAHAVVGHALDALARDVAPPLAMAA